MRQILILLAMLVSLGSIGCSAKEDMAAAEKGVEQFHQRVSEGQYALVYSEASQELKKATSEQDLVKLLGAVNSKLGPTVKATRTGWGVNVNTSGKFVSLTFDTEFESGKGTESFTYRISEGKPLLVGYHINSNDLFTK